MAVGWSARIAVHRRRLLNLFDGHDAAAVPGIGGQDPVVAQEMEPGRGTRAVSFSSSSIGGSRTFPRREHGRIAGARATWCFGLGAADPQGCG